MSRLQVCTTCLQSKTQVSKYTRSPATDSLLTKRKKMWVRCSNPLVSSGVPSWGIRPRGTNPESARKKKREGKRMGPVFYSSRKSGLPSWGNATERHQPYEVLEKKEL